MASFHPVEDDFLDMLDALDNRVEREGDEMANPLEETPELEAELDDLENDLGPTEPAEEAELVETP